MTAFGLDDEMTAIRAEDEADAESAWLKYRDDYSMQFGLSPRRAASRMRRREFVAGFIAGRQS